MKIVVYCRVSGTSQISGDGFERQLASCREFARSQSYEIEHEFMESAISGKTDMEGRPAFQEMLAVLLSNGCRTVVVESLDRLARTLQIQEQLLIYLSSKSISLISANTGENITEAMMGDPMRRAMVQIQGILSELDKNLIVAKLKKARQRMKARTGRCEGRKKYGLLPGEADVLKTIRELHMKFGSNLSTIALHLNQMEIPTRHGKKWHAATISKILRRAA